MTITRCTHLRINGARCTMPAANGKDLCFTHESRLLRMRQRPTPPSTFVTMPLVSFVYPEDHDAILDNVYAIARSYDQGMIDDRKAAIMDRLMNTALRTLRQGLRIEKTVTSDEMIRHFRLDSDGNPRALPDGEQPCKPESPEPASPQAIPEPVHDPGTVLPSITAQAEDLAPDTGNSAIVDPASPTESESPASPLLPALRQRENIVSFFSNTCASHAQKLDKTALFTPQRIPRPGHTAQILEV